MGEEKKLYLSDELIAKDWPEDFAQFIGNQKVKFPVSGGIEITLSTEIITIDSETPTNTIFVKDVLGQDIMAMDTVSGEVTKNATMIGSAAGIPLASMKKLKAADFMLLNKVGNAFLGIGQ